MKVKWDGLIDRHQRGETELGYVWIRTDKLGSVTGVYTMFGRTKKLVPSVGESWTLEDGQAIVEMELESELKFRETVACVTNKYNYDQRGISRKS